MTQPGETLGFTAADHLEALITHTAAGIFDTILVNTEAPPAPLVDFYSAKGSAPVVVDNERLASSGIRVLAADVASGGNYFRHDSGKLAAAIMSLL